MDTCTVNWRNKASKVIESVYFKLCIVKIVWFFEFALKNRMAGTLRKLKRYLKGWNILDLLGCVLFILGFFLKAASLSSTINVFVWARYVHKYIILWRNTRSKYINKFLFHIISRIVLSIDLGIWFVRGLQFCLAIPSLGPKLYMISKMVCTCNRLIYHMLI